MSIKHLLKSLTSPQQRVAFKRWKRHLKAFLKGGKKTTLEDLKYVLTRELGIQAGDRIFVTSSFGNLNAGYTPKDVVELLMSIITKEGTIMMPFYPPGNSTNWAKEGKVFDMNETKSGMGIITNVFSKMPDVKMSVHPTKAVCVWGKDAEMLTENHENSTTPYYWDSPYGKFLKMGSKSVGLGVGNMPLIHTMEDVLSESYDHYHQKNKYRLKVISKTGEEKSIDTYVHNTEIIDKCISSLEYVQINRPELLHKKTFGLTFVMCVNNDDLYALCNEEFAKGNTRVKA